ncbi:hypothetical protein [Kitasatospora sp. NPDC002040]
MAPSNSTPRTSGRVRRLARHPAHRFLHGAASAITALAQWLLNH